ncbi:DpnII family type II restriction endonuclease [Methanoculleus sp. 7T]|uniref:DpnII family type II restriction endonuclease n=1 Tax=Methanoculleus sp. 7T TaxID=2937282 RepID=UPI0020C15446|nr:DpnII family type II restriction endonuclease [Methanoculleus sp. 7T]MCK8518294.1 hypothetical protein [Methanoculleus sp. 7T]
MEQGGTIANKTGKLLETFIENLLIQKEYKYVQKKRFDSATHMLDQPIYSKQYNVCTGIYDTPIRCDFIVFHPEKHPDRLIIESKWQQSSGSADEKYPYTIHNIKEKYPCDTVLVLDGDGYKKGAEKWVRDQVGEKLRHVFNMREFQKWVNQEGL